jgi:phage-related protein
MTAAIAATISSSADAGTCPSLRMNRSAIYFKKLIGTEDVWECRIQFGSNIYRIFCFFDSHSVLILTHGFEKKSMKTPKREIEMAEAYRRDFLKRKGGKR